MIRKKNPESKNINNSGFLRLLITKIIIDTIPDSGLLLVISCQNLGYYAGMDYLPYIGGFMSYPGTVIIQLLIH